MVEMKYESNKLLGTLIFDGDFATDNIKNIFNKFKSSYDKCFSKNMNTSEIYQKNTDKNQINFNWD